MRCRPVQLQSIEPVRLPAGLPEGASFTLRSNMGDFNEKPSGAFPTFAITPSVRHKPKLQLAATRGSPTTSSKEHHDRYAGLQPKIKAFDRLRSPRERKLKSNSTASIYVNSTISSPDLDELLRTYSYFLALMLARACVSECACVLRGRVHGCVHTCALL